MFQLLETRLEISLTRSRRPLCLQMKATRSNKAIRPAACHFQFRFWPLLVVVVGLTNFEANRGAVPALFAKSRMIFRPAVFPAG